MTNVPKLNSEDWTQALSGDRDAFERVLEPFREELLADAAREVAYLRATGALRPDQLTPEELVGETLLRAWDLRSKYPADRLSMRAWLLGLQHRSIIRVMHFERQYDDRKAISLQEEVPIRPEDDHVEEDLYEFNQPFDVTTFDELLAGSMPADVEVDLDRNGQPVGDHSTLTDEERSLIDSATLDGRLDGVSRRAVLLHDEFSLGLSEVAQILNSSLKDTAEAVNMARTRLREHVGSQDDR